MRKLMVAMILMALVGCQKSSSNGKSSDVNKDHEYFTHEILEENSSSTNLDSISSNEEEVGESVVIDSLHARNGGDGVDNGGELLSLEFTRLAREVYLAIKKEGGLLSDKELDALDQAIISTRIDAVTGPILDTQNRQVDARTIFDERYNQYVIEIDKISWQEMISQRGAVHRLVFHEYLRVMGINDDNYIVSAQILEDPYLAFLRLRAPSLRGTQLFEQLKDYYQYAQRVEWDMIISKDFWEGKCFSQGEDVGMGYRFRFGDRDNGPLLEPSRIFTYVTWHNHFNRWNRLENSFESTQLVLSYLSEDLIFNEGSFRIYGDVLIVLYRDATCYAQAIPLTIEE